jgi:hypothetical protein
VIAMDGGHNRLIPVALVTKLVSLANHPSTRILQKFAVETMGF